MNSQVKWFGKLAFDYFILFGLVLLTLNSIIANWTLNPLWDLFFARVRGPIFYEVHASSILSVCFAAVYMISMNRNNIGQSVIVCFATAGIHELALAFVDIILRDFQGLATLNIAPLYFAYLSSFIVLSIIIGQPYQKRILFLQLIGFSMFYGLDIILNPGSTIIGFGPGLQFYNPVTNAIEVLSWVLPTLLWLLPKEWVIKRVHL